jgi:hypothetical protein
MLSIPGCGDSFPATSKLKMDRVSDANCEREGEGK